MKTNTTWAIVKPYNETETCLVKWVFGDKERAELIAHQMNEEEQTTKYSVELVEMFDTRDSF